MKSKRALTIVYPKTQKYACRDCPARCCRTPWGIPVAPEVAHVALQDPELRARLVGRAPGILAGGTLPMIEREKKLQCVFLDDDLLCGLQKRHGHEAIPRACQAYPFGFVQNERAEEVALLSRHCPSIRDDYGEPLAGQIEAKLAQAGGGRTLAPRMGLRSGRTLAREHYLEIARVWKERLAGSNPLLGVLGAYDATDRFDETLPAGTPTDHSVREALARLGEEGTSLRLPEPLRRPVFAARLFYSHQLGSLSYPSRVLTPFAAARPSWGNKMRSWGNKLAWLLEVGSVDLLYVTGPVAVRRIGRIPPFLDGPWGGLVRDYLSEVIERRQIFLQPTYLTRAAVDLGLMVALVSRFARASALGHGRSEVERVDVLEALGVADLLVAHQAESVQTPVLANLRLNLMSDPAAFRRFLASEV